MLNERKEKILCGIISLYIKTGEPVGSKVLLETLDISVSPATIRNEMCDLEKKGYLTSPHTSAGRIPTEQGYRYYIDNVLSKNEDISYVNGDISPSAAATADQLMTWACETLSLLTGMVAIGSVTTDKSDHVKDIQIVPIGAGTVMVVVTTTSGILKSKAIRTDFLSEGALKTFYEVSGEYLINKPLSDNSIQSCQNLCVQCGIHVLTLTPIFHTIFELISEILKGDLRLAGETTMFSKNEYKNSLSELLTFMKKKQNIFNLLNRSSDPLTILVGKETGEELLNTSGMVISKYYVNGRPLGSIAVMGPSRMDYENIINEVKYFSKIIEDMFASYERNDY